MTAGWEPRRLGETRQRVGDDDNFFESLKPRKPLKSPVLDERIQGNPSRLKSKIATKTEASLRKADESKGFQISVYNRI